jgi:molybdopterin molybdotransferase
VEHRIHPDDALSLVLEHARRHVLPTETIPLEEALGRALPFTVSSLLDQPPFDKAAIDGYAFRRPAGVISRTAKPYVVIPRPTGGARPPMLLPGQATPINTGEPLPPETEAVWRLDWTTVEGDRVRFREREPESHVIRRGEHVGLGDPLVTPRLLMPQDLAILAASGYDRVDVSARPAVAVLSTGSELRAPVARTQDPLAEDAVEKALGKSGVFDSNATHLAARLRLAAVRPARLGIAPDDVDHLATAVEEALAQHQVVVLSGGVSMGDTDHVPAVAARLGITGVFHELRMLPGRPTYFGVRGDRVLFGLPGNPLSSFLGCELFVVPYLLVRAGIPTLPPTVELTLARDVRSRNPELVQYLPGRVRWPACVVEPLPWTGPSMLNVLALADALIRIDAGQELVPEGACVPTLLIRHRV